MLVYTQIAGETAPEAFVLSGPDATVAELQERVAAVRSAQGRQVLLPFDASAQARLADCGVRAGDLVTVALQGDPRPELLAASPAAAAVPEVAAVGRKRSARLNEYEEMTQLLQWHAPYHINADRPAHQVWTDESTLLGCSDWESYRSPDSLYYRTYVNAQAKAERAVQTAFAFAAETAQLQQVDADHVVHLRGLLGALQYPDWGLCVLHQHTTRFALSSWIAGATEFMMFDELRHAQLHGRLALAYDEAHGGFDQGADLWMNAPRFQPTRRLVEELMCVLDWGQATLLAGLVVEPVLTAATRALLESNSLRSGDGLTSFVCQSIDRDKARHRESARALLALVCEDEQFGEANRPVVSGWAADWLPRATAAASALADGHPEARSAVAAAAERVQEQLEVAGAVGNAMAVSR